MLTILRLYCRLVAPTLSIRTGYLLQRRTIRSLHACRQVIDRERVYQLIGPGGGQSRWPSWPASVAALVAGCVFLLTPLRISAPRCGRTCDLFGDDGEAVTLGAIAAGPTRQLRAARDGK